MFTDDLATRLRFAHDPAYTEQFASWARQPAIAQRAADIEANLHHPSQLSPRAFAISHTYDHINVTWGYVDFAAEQAGRQLGEQSGMPAHGAISVLTHVFVQEGLIVTKRSAQVSSLQGLWSASAGEGVEASDLEGGHLNVRRAAGRGIREELAIPDSDIRQVNFRAVNLQTVRSAPQIAVHLTVDVRPCTYIDVARQAVHAEDAWEWDLLALDCHVRHLPSTAFIPQYWAPHQFTK